MCEVLHPFYQTHRVQMEATMQQRIDIADVLLVERGDLTNLEGWKQEAADEFAVVLTQMPYVGGSNNRMSNFFMRLLGFLAIGRVLHRRGVPLPVIGDIGRETLKTQMLTAPEADRLAVGEQFLSPANQAHVREQAAMSMTDYHRSAFPEDFTYKFVEPGPGDSFIFGIDYKECGFCKFAERHDDKQLLTSICGLDFDDYATRGIHLERTQTLAGGASHCNFRFSRLSREH